VGRGEHERVGVGPFERVDPDAVLVDRDADDVEAGRARDGHGVVVGARILDDQPRRAGANQHLDDERDALRVAVADCDVLCARVRAAHTVQVLGQRGVKGWRAAPADVPEILGRGPGEHAPHRAQPRGARDCEPSARHGQTSTRAVGARMGTDATAARSRPIATRV